jgi:plastocyanin
MILLRTFIILLIFSVIVLGYYGFLLPSINGTINSSFGAVPANPASLLNSSNSSAPAVPANPAGLIMPSNSSAPAVPANPASLLNSSNSSAPAVPANPASLLNSSNSSAPAVPANPASLLNSSNSSAPAVPANPKNFIIKVGQGNSSLSYNQYYPSYIEITQGDNITWYNGIKVPLPHTVTFAQGLKNLEKISLPFYAFNSTSFVPVMDNLGEPWIETTKNGTLLVMLLNYRALNPTIITNDEKVLNLGIDSKYVFQGSERFVNSGALLALDKKQNFDYPFSNFFTLVFNKPGLYEYSCLFHPWMVGKVLVKPK